MVLPNYPEKFLTYNTLQTKSPVVVVDIEGADLITSGPLYTYLRYGDADLFYGDPGIVYGGLRLVGGAGDRGQQNLLDLSGGLTLSQKIEPEQGKGSISTLSMSFIDKDGYMTRLATPGLILPDLLGRNVKIWIGYRQISFPEDFFIGFRGRVTSIKSDPGKLTLQFSDPNLNRKKNVFFSAKSSLTAGISNVDTTISVVSNGDFHNKILGPDGTYFTGVKNYIKIGDEFIEYQQTGSEATGYGTNQFVGVLRGQRGTTAVAHSINDDVEAWVEIQDHIIDGSLSLMLSRNGPWVQNLPIKNIVDTQIISVGLIPGSVIFDFDVKEENGLVVGDYVTVTGDGVNADFTAKVNSIQDLSGLRNRVVVTDNTTLLPSIASTGVASFRSQFDKYPTTCSVALPSEFVDTEGHIELKNLFLSQNENSVRYFKGSPQSCKTFIESELLLPAAAYSLTRQGRISVGYSKPAIADQRFQILNSDNIINPNTITLERATNNRKFFNEVDFSYDATDAGDFTKIVRTLDADSLNTIDVEGLLPIKTIGTRTDLGFASVIDRRTNFLLKRYADGATLITLNTNWEVGAQLEAGDVLALKDEGNLKIANWQNGTRDLGVQLFEIIDRQWNIGQGNVKLQLLQATGALTDRYATISPSSLVDVGSTSTNIIVDESYGEIFPGDERKKWKDYVGLEIIVHNYDWTISEVTTIQALDPSNNHALIVFPALSFTPSPGMIVDIANYPTSTDPEEAKLYKLVHAFLDPTVDVVSGTSQTVFDVAIGDAPKFQVGLPVLVHNQSYSLLSEERNVVSVVGTTITVDGNLGFIPAAGQFVELIGFNDKGFPYRFI